MVNFEIPANKISKHEILGQYILPLEIEVLTDPLDPLDTTWPDFFKGSTSPSFFSNTMERLAASRASASLAGGEKNWTP